MKKRSPPISGHAIILEQAIQTRSEKPVIDDEIPLLSYLNDHAHQAHFYGEPFLDERVIWYFDGEFLCITGYDIDLAPVDRTRLLSILAKAETRFEIDRVMFESPSLISIKRAYPAFSREITSWPKRYDGEFFVTPESYRFSGSRAEIIRRARRAGLECTIAEKSTSLTLDQWSLVAQHLDQFEPTPYYQTEYLTAMVSLLQHRDSVRFEVRLQDKLDGFAVVKARHPYAVFQLLYVEPNIRDISDLIYYAILEHFLGLGYRQISLGIGANPGIKAYKQKWTTTPITAGLYDLYWERDGVSEIEDVLWFSRLLSRLH